jgi:5-methylcytosine-specific restriction endonuclease McrA
MLLLDRPTLVLNRNWVPIHTLPARIAIGLVARGSARIIDPESYEVHDLTSWDAVTRSRIAAEKACIRSSQLALAPLEVIVLTCYGGVGDQTVTFSRLNLYRRDRFTCQYCGGRPGSKELTIDHVQPRSRGGHLTWENCVLACVACNKKKGSRTPEEAGMKLRSQPMRPHWQRIRRFPERPTYESWERFLSQAYWETELRE